MFRANGGSAHRDTETHKARIRLYASFTSSSKILSGVAFIWVDVRFFKLPRQRFLGRWRVDSWRGGLDAGRGARVGMEAAWRRLAGPRGTKNGPWSCRVFGRGGTRKLVRGATFSGPFLGSFSVPKIGPVFKVH